ncbi:hypothetical protein [Saccharothrix sp. ALI-22-I]|uniref:hypothetical protein n=1 Tax=Saccharothrix sp. ALI-22-I TaxID=1933778 RepID=UPI003FD072D3
MHGVEVTLDLGELVGCHPGGGEAGGDRLEQPACLGELQQRVALHEFDGQSEPFEQLGRDEAGDVGAVAAAHVEHPGHGQGFDASRIGLREMPDSAASRGSGGSFEPGGSFPDWISVRMRAIASSVSDIRRLYRQTSDLSQPSARRHHTYTDVCPVQLGHLVGHWT